MLSPVVSAKQRMMSVTFMEAHSCSVNIVAILANFLKAIEHILEHTVSDQIHQADN